MRSVKNRLDKLIVTSKIGKFLLKVNFNARFTDSVNYWEKRYLNKGNSGPGSLGACALYKANILNTFVAENSISSVIEFGCGDGNQLANFQFPSYIGLDVSVTALQKCVDLFKVDMSKSFFIYDPKGFVDNAGIFKADLALSLDVIYHLLEDDVFEAYMRHLFLSSSRFVIVYAWNVESKKSLHVRYRKFTDWIESHEKEWVLIQTIENKTNEPICDFFVYKKVAG